MTPEQEQYLLDNYPELYWFNKDNPKDRSPYIYGFDIGPGWFELIKDLSDEILPIVRANNELLEEEDDVLRIIQIKEKFGGLRYYFGAVTIDYFDKIEEIVQKYEEKSYTICEQCGEPGELRNDLSWIGTLCDKHYKECKK